MTAKRAALMFLPLLCKYLAGLQCAQVQKGLEHTVSALNGVMILIGDRSGCSSLKEEYVW